MLQGVSEVGEGVVVGGLARAYFAKQWFVMESKNSTLSKGVETWVSDGRAFKAQILDRLGAHLLSIFCAPDNPITERAATVPKASILIESGL